MTPSEPDGDGRKVAVDAWRKERFRIVYEATYGDIASYCRRRLPGEAVDDAVAEVFTIVWQRLDDLPAGDASRPWTFGVARNVVKQLARKRRRSTDLENRLANEIATNSATGNDPVLGAERARALVEALHSLRSRDQELLRLIAWEKLSHAEAAVVFGCSENAVATRLHRSRTKLTRVLNRDTRWSESVDLTSDRKSGKSVKGSAPRRDVPADGRTPKHRREASR